jgi:hypothetical protein
MAGEKGVHLEQVASELTSIFSLPACHDDPWGLSVADQPWALLQNFVSSEVGEEGQSWI